MPASNEIYYPQPSPQIGVLCNVSNFEMVPKNPNSILTGSAI